VSDGRATSNRVRRPVFIPDDVPIMRYSAVASLWQSYKDKGLDDLAAATETALKLGVYIPSIGSLLEEMGLMKWWVE
jgi:hypothetical protein